ncbi:MAG: ATP-dependent DNA helicase RecG [Corynebacterium sp.]|uniref:ATP-dependent DNA helicase RecG n=2 Tax=Corynebacteriaceae TaxID=1653 RepID=UPI00264A1DA6|nr:ATP-dependent DNA helicase RecG [Corynebacterium sp.]MDN6304466.1 ATP-dependent DNA helicase RecG [Corynebacterium sp.]MDN6366335.1 ATP-dependent DNA helicase RecG [Corynebacterium sp.]MDN6374832.1 ATP-dependent DNA helicase RecG [Corynebacterium sp.]MDN6395059.1 ATP-dependent DNA helicase RecG [Corynebacterium sp.]MDN6403371.1 ATP-dependent DNA helicase RecG [Corynebacterium sp.]
MLGWDDPRPLSQVIPPDRARTLAGKPGLVTMADALLNFPASYVHTSGTGAMSDGGDGLVEGDHLTCLAEITWTQVQDNRGRRGPREILNFRFRVDGVDFSSALFGNVRSHQPFIAIGAKVMLAGKLGLFRDEWQLRNPSYITLHPPPVVDGEPLTGEAYEAAFGAFGPLKTIVDVAGGMRAAQQLLSVPWLPTYPRRHGTNNAELLGVMGHVLDAMASPPEMLPSATVPGAPAWPVIDGAELIGAGTALHDIHRPPEDGPDAARTRVKFNEALALQLVMALRREDSTARTGRAVVPVSPGSKYAALIQKLPYTLTDSQTVALTEIGAAMEGAGTGAASGEATAAASGAASGTTPMSMLLQGDVGSGKTIVALLAMLRVVDSGGQCAFLAPTEVLATQHAQTLGGLLEGSGVNISLLTGSQSTAERREALLDIISGTADIVIGTHAVIQDSVEFFDLGMVVVDEQHRFGVRQRDRLRETSPVDRTPHLLVMTATPIPRTVAMTMFGDLTLCTLETAPAGRGEINSFVVPMWKRSWVDRMYAVIREQAEQGHRTYIVVPRIEGEGGVDEVATRLQGGELRGLRVGTLHGRMDNKAEIMDGLASGRIDVLVSTTVIEVGVDIPEATVMVVMEAENFGVSQLHQLRGRVGRGEAASMCFLCTDIMPDAEGTTRQAVVSYQRLEAVAGTRDGFALAELDLRSRTEGDVLGEKQSGHRVRRVKILDLSVDSEIVFEARRYAEELVAYDEQLARSLVADITVDDQDYIERN